MFVLHTPGKQRLLIWQIVYYRLQFLDCTKKILRLPISDCHLVPITNYRLWQTNLSDYHYFLYFRQYKNSTVTKSKMVYDCPAAGAIPDYQTTRSHNKPTRDIPTEPQSWRQILLILYAKAHPPPHPNVIYVKLNGRPDKRKTSAWK